MTERLSIRLPEPLSEMAREECLKSLAFVSTEVRDIAMDDEGATIACTVPRARAAELEAAIVRLASGIQQRLAGLERRLVFQSRALGRPARFDEPVPGAVPIGRGAFVLKDLSLALYRYFDRVLAGIGLEPETQVLLPPVMIRSDTLARCNYFQSFPHAATFACHLHEDVHDIEQFRTRYADGAAIGAESLALMSPPEYCLLPAVCFHVYALHEGQTIPAGGASYALCGRCFRFESSNFIDLRRLWEFTMREVVYLGRAERVFALRQRAMHDIGTLLNDLDLAAEIRTASDPFFASPDALMKTFFQLSAETKFEVSAVLPHGERLAVASFNYHADFFGRAFDVSVEHAGVVHSACVGFGLERWVHAFLAQHGASPDRWPSIVRDAPELQGIQTAVGR